MPSLPLGNWRTRDAVLGERLERARRAAVDHAVRAEAGGTGCEASALSSALARAGDVEVARGAQLVMLAHERQLVTVPRRDERERRGDEPARAGVEVAGLAAAPPRRARRG